MSLVFALISRLQNGSVPDALKYTSLSAVLSAPVVEAPYCHIPPQEMKNTIKLTGLSWISGFIIPSSGGSINRKYRALCTALHNRKTIEQLNRFLIEHTNK